MKRENIILGDNLKFNSGLEIKHFTVREILDIGVHNYIEFTNFFILKPQDLIVQLWGNGIYYEDITQDELFLMLINQNKEFFFEMFKIFTNCDNVWIEYINEMESDAICYSMRETIFYIGYSVFDEIYKYFKEMRLYVHSEKRFFSGEKTKKIILDEDYNEFLTELKSNKNNTEFSDMISFLVISNKRNWEQIYAYPIGRFYEEYVKTLKKQRADNILHGVYCGTVDNKRIKDSDLKWFKTQK